MQGESWKKKGEEEQNKPRRNWPRSRMMRKTKVVREEEDAAEADVAFCIRDSRFKRVA